MVQMATVYILDNLDGRRKIKKSGFGFSAKALLVADFDTFIIEYCGPENVGRINSEQTCGKNLNRYSLSFKSTMFP